MGTVRLATKLPASYYQQEDVVALAKDLLGKIVVTQIDAVVTSGRITETEAYRGWGDKACHAHQGRFTERTKIMYEPGGVSYVYLCYGIHNLFNIITNTAGNADAVLIRAIEPLEGLDVMLERRGHPKNLKKLLIGPGNVTKALGITKSMNAEDLQGNKIWIEDDGFRFRDSDIRIGPRIGIDYAEEDKDLPWRFWTW